MPRKNKKGTIAMPIDGSMDYIELPASDMEAAMAFYRDVFDWGDFTSYGPDYMAFVAHGRDGGFHAERKVAPADSGVLLVLYANDLDATEAKVKAAGGEIIGHEEFPGGRRFAFRDPNGNELAVWTKR
jgi:predicted enzyme related to lactoylglutathione lyase